MTTLELPSEVLVAVERILTSNDHQVDQFSGKNFNLARILNEYFPDEASLAHLEQVKAQLSQTEANLQQELSSLRERLQQEQDAGRMQLIQEMISDLLGQISKIQEKATESEAVVRDITKDIQVLDQAKKNLILSMTTLKRLQMLVGSLSQLEGQVNERRYGDIVQSLAAVKQLSASFKPFTTIKRISQVWNRVQEVQGQLRTYIEADFDAFILQDSSKAVKPSTISEACKVVNILGPDVQSPLLDRYVALELKEYRRIFKLTDEAGQLDNLSRRFAWFRRMLSNYELEQGRIFPPEWQTGWHLLARFTEITRDDVAALLSKSGSLLTVKILLDSLTLTTEFELSFAKKWATSFTEIIESTAKTHASKPKSISSAFEPHMGLFVDAQDRALSDLLAPYRKPQTTRSTPRVSLESSGPQKSGDDEDDQDSPRPIVMPSSTQLFYFYGQSLEQCSKLSTRKPLFDLGNLHKKWLRIYADEIILGSLKRSVSTTATSAAARRSSDVRFDMEQLEKAAMAVNTADYCHVTALELEQKIKDKVDEGFRDAVTFQAECDLFMNAVSIAIAFQLRELEIVIDPAFQSLTRTTWMALTQEVTGPSSYTDDLIRQGDLVMDVVKRSVEQKKYLRNFYDKACALVSSKFTNALVKSRPLGSGGAEQLLIDLQSIKSWLLRMPGESLITTSYTKAVNKSASRLETLLKVIVTPEDPPEGFILNYTLLVGDASFSNFQKILDLRGTPKAEQNHLLDTFLTITSTKDDLESTSFLSSLDMDPPTTSQLAALTSGQLGSGKYTTMPLGGDAFGSLTPPPMSGPPTGSHHNPTMATESTHARQGDNKVLADLKRFVSFGLRRDTAPSPAAPP